ncbi:MAG TPA: F0F1 ATP synthase subunit delta [Burkholderiaceae bacterium]|jgi:F-type H+-transporting ATPase subunit delta|nr:F0F1 ATP synthase subunit delta [Burkholderiaceae bacterium]
MAELATVARPYAEALFEAVPAAEAAEWVSQVETLGTVAADAQLRQFAEDPRVSAAQVFDLIVSVVKRPLATGVQNLLRTVIENRRLVALPEVASQFHALVNAQSGVSDAVIHSAFPIDGPQLADVKAALERRFGRKLETSVVVDPSLIGGIRAVVGDEVLDTSVKARLEHMKAALTA